MTLTFERPNPRQRLFLTDRHRYVAFGGARGGGKSWAVRTKAALLALRFPGIRILIVRRSYPELQENHIKQMRAKLQGVARYNEQQKELRFRTGSVILFRYCDNDGDADRFQGMEFDVIFIDEATQIAEEHLRKIFVTCRGVNDFPKRIYLTCNPGGVSHGYIKRLFVDRKYEAKERPEDYAFIKSLVSDNKALTESDPEYVARLEALPEKLRRAWLEGDWNVFEGQFFAEFRTEPDEAMLPPGMGRAQALREHRWTHVIEPFEIPRHWNIYRSFDFGFAKPFSVGWWAVAPDGTVYRILELYGCTREPNEGVKWHPDKIFSEIARIEQEHRWLAGKTILGVADPSIWDRSRGDAIADFADRHGVYFEPGDNKRIPGWMQVHYRLSFGPDGRAGMYVFSGCRAFIRTMPLLQFSETNPEDLDTRQEDHVADEVRYFLMTRPLAPEEAPPAAPLPDDPLDLRQDGYLRL